MQNVGSFGDRIGRKYEIFRSNLGLCFHLCWDINLFCAMRYNNNLRFLLKQEQVAEELRQGLNRQPSSKLRSSNTLDNKSTSNVKFYIV